MEPTFQQTATDKAEKYKTFISEYRLYMSGEKDEIAVMANTSAALREAFGFFWVGFYLVKSALRVTATETEELVLGPCQGTAACFRIRKGRGVCGTAWSTKETQVVPDVEAFPGHIACSSASRSEIVIPILRRGEVKGVLDIDSDQLNTFDEIDKKYLEEIIEILCETVYA